MAPGTNPERFWLFTRGAESIRLVREVGVKECRLVLQGPGHETAVHDFVDAIECIRRQAAIERDLLAAGFKFSQLYDGDRRRQPPVRPTPIIVEPVIDHARSVARGTGERWP